MYRKELEIALNAVRKASHLCRKVQNSLVTVSAIEKKDRSPVTIADFGSQAVINLELLEFFPNDPIVAEEDAEVLLGNAELREQVLGLVNEQKNAITASRMTNAIDLGSLDTDFAKRFWTVDPIDGTKGFLRGEQYAVALALVEKGEVMLGVLGCPNFETDNGEKGCLFYAVRGQGAFMHSLDNDTEKPVSVDSIRDAAQACFCESFEKAHASHEVHESISSGLGITAPARRMDSQAKYAAVSCGQASIYLRLPRSRAYREKIWDHAAGAIVVAEAGGRVTDFSGRILDFSAGRTLENNVGILASNGHLHNEVLRAISEVRSEK